METNLARLCRLCLETSDDIVNIFESFQGTTIASILTQHFWFQAFKGDGFSESLCEICWINTKTFHNFYKRIEWRQKKCRRPVSVRKDLYSKVAKQERCDSPVIEPDLSIVKCEETELTAQVIDSQINKEESLDDDYDCERSETTQISKDENQPSNKQRKTDTVAGDNVTESITLPPSTEWIRSDDDDDSNESPQNSNVKSTSLADKNAKIREFFNVECDICSAKFETFHKVRKHYRIAHNVPGYVSCCGRKFHRLGVALNHIFYHSNPDAFRCDQCGKRFCDKSALKGHIEVNHVLSNLRAYKCDECPKTFTKAISLKYHKQLKHALEEDKKFPCEQCDKKFVTRSTMAYHVRSYHDLAFALVCDICARVCKTKSSLQIHMKVHQVLSSAEKPKAQCNVCGIWLSNELGVKKHLKRHEATTVNCPICKQLLQNKYSLKQHIRRVHGERNHPCTICVKKFKSPLHLREHMACHTGQDLYSCPYCPKTFKSGANMFSHRKKSHFAEWSREPNKRIIVEQTSTK